MNQWEATAPGDGLQGRSGSTGKSAAAEFRWGLRQCCLGYQHQARVRHVYHRWLHDSKRVLHQGRLHHKTGMACTCSAIHHGRSCFANVLQSARLGSVSPQRMTNCRIAHQMEGPAQATFSKRTQHVLLHRMLLRTGWDAGEQPSPDSLGDALGDALPIPFATFYSQHYMYSDPLTS